VHCFRKSLQGQVWSIVGVFVYKNTVRSLGRETVQDLPSVRRILSEVIIFSQSNCFPISNDPPRFRINSVAEPLFLNELQIHFISFEGYRWEQFEIHSSKAFHARPLMDKHQNWEKMMGFWLPVTFSHKFICTTVFTALPSTIFSLLTPYHDDKKNTSSCCPAQTPKKITLKKHLRESGYIR
jgi:hypothetical protein